MNLKKGDAIKIILKGLLYSGAVFSAASSRNFFSKNLPKLIEFARYEIEKKKIQEKKFYNAFTYLKNRGFVKIGNKGGQIYISLTKEGRNFIGKYQVDDLEIKKPRKWDKKWRILIFDIKEKNKIKREALRGKLKELGLYKLQKSVWVCPYDFFREINTLRNFFGLKNSEMKIITATELEDEKDLRLFFGLK